VNSSCTEKLPVVGGEPPLDGIGASATNGIGRPLPRITGHSPLQSTGSRKVSRPML
jgi:hypothetical protein